MLENIKSSFFIRYIFSFLDEATKLKIIKYNKALQNEIDINIINYKLFSKRYIIYEEKGKVKEINSYNNEDIMYVGENLNGKRNGKGKEYNKGKLIYEGEFLNGKRDGKGNEYKNNKLFFIGEYSKGLKNGNGIKYNYYKNLLFEGEYLNGLKWNGKGYDDKNNVIYELKNGNGKVKEYDIYSNLLFEGEYLNGNIWNGILKEYI